MRRFDQQDDDQPPLPKPYAFVPIPEKRMGQERPVGHDLYQGNLLTGRIEGTLNARSPVHVGSGNIEVTGKVPSLAKTHFRRNDRPVIPGSSLKGVVRSIVEAISDPPSCLRVMKKGFDYPPANVRACKDKERLCVTCRIFGAMDYQGLIAFSDAPLEQGNTEIIQIPTLHPPGMYERERVYFDERRVKGRKFYMHGRDGKTAHGNAPIEACKVGSRFPLRVDFKNLNPDQLGLLLTALGQGQPPLFPKLGGAKPVCCGSLEITEVDITSFQSRSSSLDFDLKQNLEDMQGLIRANRMVNGANLNEVAEILKYPGERECPDRNY